jgi:hypothetical protein
MSKKQRRECPEILCCHVAKKNWNWVLQYLLHHESVDVHKAVLQQVKAEHGQLLAFSSIGGDFSAFAEQDKIVYIIPKLDDIQI